MIPRSIDAARGRHGRPKGELVGAPDSLRMAAGKDPQGMNDDTTGTKNREQTEHHAEPF